MQLGWVIDYDALNAWSALVAGIGTVAAVVVALWQSAKAQRDATSQQKYRNWLEQKRLEEEHLSRMLDVVNDPYRLAQEFFFSAKRLLSGIPTAIAPEPQQIRDVQNLFDSFIRDSRRSQVALESYIEIAGALRELHRTRGDSAEAEQDDKLLQEVISSFDANNALHQSLANEQVIRTAPVETFFDQPLVEKARETTARASRMIARRLVRLYEAPPSR